MGSPDHAPTIIDLAQPLQTCGHMRHGDSWSCYPTPASAIWLPSLEISWNLFIGPHSTAPGPTPRDGTSWLGPSRLGIWDLLELPHWQPDIGWDMGTPWPGPAPVIIALAHPDLGHVGHGDPWPWPQPLLVTSGGHHWRPVETCSFWPHCTAPGPTT